MKLTRAALGAIALTTASVLALAGCADSGSSTGSAPEEWPTLTIAAVAEPTSFDPSQAAEANFAQYFQPVFDTLIRRAPDGTLEPMLATEWSLSDDGLTATLTLRDDVTFSDGTAFDATVAKANLERFRDNGGPFSGNLATMTTVEAPDATTIVITLGTPDPDIFQYLGNSAGYMASPAQFDSPTKDTEPIGSGPYELDRSQTVTGSVYTYTKRDDYWDTEATWDFFDTLEIKPIVDPTARVNALKSGEADAGIVEPKAIPEAEGSGLNVTTFQVNWYGLSLFDRDGAMVPALGDVRVRQAINHAIDSDAILQAVELGYGELTDQTFNTESEAYIEADDDAYPYDVEKAKELMAEAGYSDGFEVTVPSTSSMDPAMVAAVTQDLAEIGIRTDWTEVADADFIPQLRTGSFAMSWMSFAQPPTAWGTISRFVLPTAPWNVFKTSDETIDAAVQTALANPTDEAAYADAVQTINQTMVDEAWNAPFYRVQQAVVSVKGITAEGQAGQAAPSIYNYSIG
ncbi:peptide ABC transporter substrate-binding protein [Microbacteriaceae bacterium VKM Ac-2855]|nr:peptide ABC transporter substrate-binding protein [Microbacteriaceae bacterium VKM Ac-2855]